VAAEACCYTRRHPRLRDLRAPGIHSRIYIHIHIYSIVHMYIYIIFFSRCSYIGTDALRLPVVADPKGQEKQQRLSKV
jgi:hypothetical protein